ncbi:MAG TPA: hypothetical protein VIM70_16580 [Clostridium sp.]|uniref:hypothetical protein n=1 Tax=Clostridium sp. TaxID=1506 RepID=UPI002F93F338
MNYLHKIAKGIKSKQRKKKNDSNKGFVVFTVLGLSIGGAIAGLFARRYCDEIKDIIVSNAKDSDYNEDNEDNEDNEEINIKREEIKDTLNSAPNKSVGDVGVAMEKAIEDLEDEEDNVAIN